VKQRHPAAQAAAKKAALKASATHPVLPPAVRLLDKHEVCAITNVTFPTVWAWMIARTFPRARIVGGKSMWRSDEVDAWLAGLPVRALKGDPPNPPEVV
jgi:predicted DNA-binding transcriptional regulator AlpA